MMIIRLYKDIGSELCRYGSSTSSNDLLEFIGPKFDLSIPLNAVDKARSSFIDYLTNELDYPLGPKLAQEKYHYAKLMSALAHSIGENFFYKKTQLCDSRQYVALSTDCISSIQVMVRKSDLHINVFFRSSHYQKLLPADLLFLLSVPSDFLKAATHINQTFDCGWHEDIDKVSVVNMNLMFGSLHRSL